jgi:hypothetical protein
LPVGNFLKSTKAVVKWFRGTLKNTMRPT